MANPAFDSYFGSAESLDANDITVACTPVGTPKGVVVFIHGITAGNQVTGVTYGGTAMSEVTGSPLLKATVELMSECVFFLGASVPTGAQNCVVDRSGSNSMFVDVVLLTADGDTAVIDSDTVQSDSAANPSTPELNLGGQACFVAIGFGCGGSSPAAFSPRANWTARAEHDHGSQSSGCYTYDVVDTANVTPGWDGAADDANGISVAIGDATVPVAPTVTTSTPTATSPRTMSGGGNVTDEGTQSVTARGICISTSANPTTSDSHSTDGTGAGSFSSIRTGLLPNTLYHVRAYATSAVGTSYGSDETFTTDSVSITGPMLAGRVTTGVAPLYYHGDTMDDVYAPIPAANDTGDPDPDGFNVFWNFGDPSSGNFANTGRSKNYATEHAAIHVFEAPGTYLVSRRIDMGGTTYRHTETVIVTDPDDVFDTPGVNKFFINRDTGDDGNDGSSATDLGGGVGPWLTMTTALSATGIFSVSSAMLSVAGSASTYAETSHSAVSSKDGPYLIKWDGTGAKPVIALSSGITCLNLAATVSGLRMVDIDITGTDDQTALIPGTDCCFVGCNVTGVGSGISISGTLRTGVGLWDCNIELDDAAAQYCVYGEVLYKWGFGGCVLDSNGATGEYTSRVYPSHSVWTSVGFNGGTPGKGGNRCSGFHPTGDPGRGGYEPTEAAEYNVFTDCYTDDPGSAETQSWQFGIINSAGDTRVLQNTIISRPKIVAGAAVLKALLIDAAHCITVKNYVCDLTAAVDAEAVQIQRSGSVNTVPTGTKVLGVTTIVNGTYTGNGVQIDANALNTLVQNAGVFSVGASCGDADGVSDSAAPGETTIVTCDVYDITDLADIATGEINSNAAAVDAGTVYDSLYDDWQGLGIFAVRDDVGAWELGTALGVFGGKRAPGLTRPGRSLRYQR